MLESVNEERDIICRLKWMAGMGYDTRHYKQSTL